MRISDTYDAAAIDELCRLEAYEQLAELGFNFRKLIKKIGTPFMKVTRAQFKPIRRFFTKKFFLKAAPFLSIAAELLNLVVPGLGVAIGIAISLTATAMALHDKKVMEKKAKAATAAANAQDQATIDKADSDANASLDSAFNTGQAFFMSAYGETPAMWQKLTIDGKTRFLNVAIYDRNATNMQAIGISRDAFQKLSTAQQHDALAKGAEALPAASGTYTPNVPTAAETPTAQAPSTTEPTATTPVVPPVAPLVAATLPPPPEPVTLAPASTTSSSTMTYALVGGGAALLLLGYAIYQRQHRKSLIPQTKS